MGAHAFNWVTQAGGLPPAIHRLAKKLERKGHDQSSAIAIAVAAAKRFAPQHPAWAAAVAEWERKRASAHVSAHGSTHVGTYVGTFGRQDRPLREYERLMALDEIERALDTARDHFEHAAGGRARVVARSIAQTGKPDRDAVQALQESIVEQLEALYATGRQTVADELAAQGAAHSEFAFARDLRPRWLRRRAKLATDGIVARILQAVGRLTVADRHTDADVQLAAEAEAAAALRSEAQVHAVPALNQGRADEADARKSEIRGSRYTSILDKNRCERCAMADDDTLRPLTDPVRLHRRPPNPDCYGGGRCRCMEFFELRREGAPSFSRIFDQPSPQGVMVALYPDPDSARALAVDGGEPADQLHVTLAYLGKVADHPDQAALIGTVERWASSVGPLEGVVSGVGVFTEGEDDAPVTYWSVDSPALPHVRQQLVELLAEAGCPASAAHGFTPHMTVAYGRPKAEPPRGFALRFTEVTVAYGGEQTHIPLAGGPAEFDVFEWDEHQHPRWPKGHPLAGQFRPQAGPHWRERTGGPGGGSMRDFPSMKAKKLYKVLERAPLNYNKTRQTGSHRTYKSESGYPVLHLPFHEGETLPGKMVRKILVKDVGLDPERARGLL